MLGKSGPAAPPPEPAGKGRPTPTRKQAEAARKRPLGGAGVGRATTPLSKEQQKAARRKAREQWDHAMRTGDERYLPARDKGPERRFARDWIDSRRSVGEYIVYLALGSLVALFLLMQLAPGVAAAVMLLMYVIVFAVIADGIVRGRLLKKALVAKFGAGNLPRGVVWYGVNRSMQPRRNRMPNPQVKIGQHPG
ncbi:MAG: DUF3043 domain-containing protein [Bifidobacteriaceae bacterium]|nr:DUF3043 domain-containing protein [Bifidobacteriaceae bacterium]